MTTTCTACTAKTDRTLCKPCLGKLAGWLNDMPELVGHVDDVVTRQHRFGDSSGPRSSERPLVFHLGASDALYALAGVLVSTARGLAARGYAEPVLAGVPRAHLAPLPRDADVAAPMSLARVEQLIPRAASAAAAMSAAAWLSAHLDRVALDDRAGQWWHAIREAVEHADRMCVPPPPDWYAGPCDDCSADLMVTVGGDGRPAGHVVECVQCGAEHELEGRREWLLDRAKQYLVPRQVALSWVRILMEVTVPPGTFDAWVNRRRIVSHGTNGYGYPLYPFGEVVVRVTAWLTERRGKRTA